MWNLHDLLYPYVFVADVIGSEVFCLLDSCMEGVQHKIYTVEVSFLWDWMKWSYWDLWQAILFMTTRQTTTYAMNYRL